MDDRQDDTPTNLPRRAIDLNTLVARRLEDAMSVPSSQLDLSIMDREPNPVRMPQFAEFDWLRVDFERAQCDIEERHEQIRQGAEAKKRSDRRRQLFDRAVAVFGAIPLWELGKALVGWLS